MANVGGLPSRGRVLDLVFHLSLSQLSPQAVGNSVVWGQVFCWQLAKTKKETAHFSP